MKKGLSKILTATLSVVLIGSMGTTSLTFANENMKMNSPKTETTVTNASMMAEASAKRAEIEATLKVLELEKDALHATLLELEAKHHTAKEAGDTTLMASLETSITALKNDITLKHDAINSALAQLKKAIHEEFSADSMMKKMKFKAEIEKNMPELTVLELESVFAQGHKFNFNVPPVMKEERIMMPVRAIAEAVGAEIVWDLQSKTVTLTKDDKVIKIHLNTKEVHVNDVKVELTDAAFSLKGNMYVPLDFIAKEFGFDITWHEALKMSELTHRKGQAVSAPTEVKNTDEPKTDDEHEHE